MKKAKTKYVCQECGYVSPTWLGKCSECNNWGSFVEEFIEKEVKVKSQGISTNAKPIPITQIKYDKEERTTTAISELDLVLGGGIVNGSLILVGGDPGIGKSTLLLQVAHNLAEGKKRVLYVSGEESISQTKIRADRLDAKNEELYIVSENNMDFIVKYVADLKPDILIIDSIQTVFSPDLTSAPGSVSQVREATSILMRISKGQGIATFLVGHVTKSGSIAGPKVLEHMVDTVLYFEGEKHNTYRVLRAVKNRFGSTNEIGIFEMTNRGLIEVKNPSHLFISNRPIDATGSIIVSGIEGTRSVLVEIQALISGSGFGMPRRMAVGIDHNKVVMLIAVLEKKLGVQLQDQDAYVNVIGGMQLNEPAVDLAIIAAIVSSFREKPIHHGTVIFGEVGLTGEVRAVNLVEKRINEAFKMGFEKCIIPYGNLEGIQYNKGMKVVGVKSVEEIFSELFS